MKKLNKINFLQLLALVNRRFSYESQTFERSIYVMMRSQLILLLNTTMPLKFFVSILFPRRDLVQLFIGNPYNYLPDVPRATMGRSPSAHRPADRRRRRINQLNNCFLSAGFIGLICIPWQISHHFIFCHRNAKNDYYRFRYWLRMTGEIPGAHNYRAIGVSESERKQFWRAQDRFNFYYYRVVNYFFLVGFSLVNLQYFLIGFDVPLVAYVLIQVIHSLQNSYFAFSLLHSIYTLNCVFYTQVIRFLAKKFGSIGQEVRRLNASGRMRAADRRKLEALIGEFNETTSELMERNRFFREFVGMNVLHFFSFGILVSIA